MKTNRPEELEIRCPRLGGTVPFRYCMAPAEPTVCFKILDCWWEMIDVTSYLKEHLPEEDFCRFLENRNRPNRMESILELVEKFKSKESGQGGT